MSKFILHCGFPKTGSTSIQFRLNNSNHNYLGFYPNDKNGMFYKTKELSYFFEQVVRFGTEKSFKKTSKKIKNFLENETSKNSKKVILSNENIIGRFIPYDLPNEIKIYRAAAVLPKNSIVVIGIRNLKELLYSYYKLLLSNGYGEDINYFFKELKTLESSFGIIESFRIKTIIETFNQIRPDLQIRIFDIKREITIKKAFDNIKLPILKNIKNKSFKLQSLPYHLKLNNSFYKGKRFLDWLEIHRVFPKAGFDSQSTYRLSRSRHLHNTVASQLDYLKEGKDLEKIFRENIPNFIEKISLENDTLLKKIL